MRIGYWRPEPMMAFLDKPLRLCDESKLIRQRG
jgi:hypothetical protein